MIIVYYEQGHSKREMANKFEIEPKQLRDWLQNKDKLIKVAPYIQKLTPGSRPKYPELETELLNWFKKSRSQLKVVTHYMIQAKAHSFANRAVYQDMYTNINTAKFSQKWVDSFMTCYNLVNTTVAQRLPDNYVKLQNSFLFYILYQKKKINIRYR